ncbi:MAG: hypothetical protein RJA18_1664, partial [Pseudomonadota bacterium]
GLPNNATRMTDGFIKVSEHLYIMTHFFELLNESRIKAGFQFEGIAGLSPSAT